MVELGLELLSTHCTISFMTHVPEASCESLMLGSGQAAPHMQDSDQAGQSWNHSWVGFGSGQVSGETEN